MVTYCIAIDGGSGHNLLFGTTDGGSGHDIQQLTATARTIDSDNGKKKTKGDIINIKKVGYTTSDRGQSRHNKRR